MKLQILTRVLPKALHGRLAYLSGPSFAAEVAAGLPTVVTIAAADDNVAARAQALLSTPRFRCYRTTDVIGAHCSRWSKESAVCGSGRWGPRWMNLRSVTGMVM